MTTHTTSAIRLDGLDLPVSGQGHSAAAPRAFVHPKSVDELLEKDPDYLRNWLHSKQCPYERMDDIEQGLLHYMGVPDKLASYVPEGPGGTTTKRAWASWFDGLLMARYREVLVTK